MDKEKLLVSAILFNHNVPINEAKIIGVLIENLEQQNKKQKEMIDKLSKIIYEINDLKETTGGYPSHYLDDLVNILKKV